ncbi:MAG: two-component system, OmpR family, sensor histidine kinase KdpD [Actinomycetota bacterium]|jgi:two-component system sensor histidine kinase KdpD|nr:two-component system, OmpR family, sensor histidine kinase KdpD [Actinomycetota bacterium]MDQ1499885.1 two-component system, OmpR family, sensor histidine kinase KdpD [Actinomycetota bacterium]
MLAGWVVTVAGLAVATAGVLPFRSDITVATAALVLVVPVALGVAVGGFSAVPVGVAFGFLTFDFFFIPPYSTFYVTEWEDWISLVVYAMVGCTVGGVVAQLGRAQREAEARRAEAQLLWAERARLVEESSRLQLLEEVDRLRAALIGSVSHDLRTPLASIKASISDLADPGLLLSDDDRATLLRTTEEETDRLTRLVTNLLDMSRIQAGALVPHTSATPLDELIGAVAGRLGPTLGEGRLAVEIADGLPLADVDYLLVEQVLSNLLENAARYTPPGTAVTVRAAAVGDGEVEVAVVDHGPGVAEQERERIFDQFYRLRAEGQGPVGTGMGLAIVKGIAEAHGGRIWVEGTPGGGATFVLRLPVSPESMLPDDGEPAAAVAPPAKA